MNRRDYFNVPPEWRVPQRPVRQRPRRMFRKTIRSLLLVLILLFASGMGALYFSNSTVRESVGIIVTREYSVERAFPERSEINVLFMGRDVDLDNRGRVMDTRGRTDAMILAHFNFNDKTCNMLSIPRDTRVRIPGYRGSHKINAAHAFGGPELAQETVGDFLGVHPDAYAVIDYEAFIQAIDYVGGLHVNVDKQLDYDDNWGNLHIHLKPGMQRLMGYDSMGFVRYRKSNDGLGDTDVERIARQQELVRAAKQKLMQPSAMIKLPGLLTILRDNINSDLSYQQMCSLAYYLKTLPAEAIRMETVPGEEGRVYVKADVNATRELVQRMFY